VQEVVQVTTTKQPKQMEPSFAITAPLIQVQHGVNAPTLCKQGKQIINKERLRLAHGSIKSKHSIRHDVGTPFLPILPMMACPMWMW